MDYIEPFADFRHDLWCIHCGTSKETNSFTRDHLPTKSLLDRPLPTDLPTFAICADCNNSLSRDEEYLKVFLACILDGTCEPSEMSDPKIGRSLARNGRLLAELRSARTMSVDEDGNEQLSWRPDLSRIMPPLIKNARGHFTYELAERADGDPLHAWAYPLYLFDDNARRAFESPSFGDVWPEIGSRMMDRLATGKGTRGGWIIVQPGVYRYAIHEQSTVRIVIRELLAFEAKWP